MQQRIDLPVERAALAGLEAEAAVGQQLDDRPRRAQEHLARREPGVLVDPFEREGEARGVDVQDGGVGGQVLGDDAESFFGQQ